MVEVPGLLELRAMGLTISIIRKDIRAFVRAFFTLPEYYGALESFAKSTIRNEA